MLASLTPQKRSGTEMHGRRGSGKECRQPCGVRVGGGWLSQRHQDLVHGDFAIRGCLGAPAPLPETHQGPTGVSGARDSGAQHVALLGTRQHCPHRRDCQPLRHEGSAPKCLKSWEKVQANGSGSNERRQRKPPGHSLARPGCTCERDRPRGDSSSKMPCADRGGDRPRGAVPSARQRHPRAGSEVQGTTTHLHFGGWRAAPHPPQVPQLSLSSAQAAALRSVSQVPHLICCSAVRSLLFWPLCHLSLPQSAVCHPQRPPVGHPAFCQHRDVA